MRAIRISLFLGIGISGLLVGYGSHLAFRGRTVESNAPPQDATAVHETTPAKPARTHSADTVESLAAIPGGPSYGRLAAWLMDAGEQDIAAYWRAVKDKPRSDDITALIFIHWTRLNPQAAIAAVAGTGTEHDAWWAWACHDPADALKAAIAGNPGCVNDVVRGIGEFHPQWLMQHFDEIPASARDSAISGLAKSGGADRPLEILDFLKRHNSRIDPEAFTAAVCKDPWAALDWMRDNMDTIRHIYGTEDSAMTSLVRTLAASNPDALERLAAQAPSGDLKRRMEAALFDKLLETDPAAALEQANQTKAPAVATQRLAAVGLNRLKDDPDQAFEIARKMLSAGPSALDPLTNVAIPNAGIWMACPASTSTKDFMDALMAKDPARTMAMIPAPTDRTGQSFLSLCKKWADCDLGGYANWVKQQTNPAVREMATEPVVRLLTQSEQFPAAAAWAATSPREMRDMRPMFYLWQCKEPGAPAQWLESADMPAAVKGPYLEYLKTFR